MARLPIETSDLEELEDYANSVDIHINRTDKRGSKRGQGYTLDGRSFRSKLKRAQGCSITMRRKRHEEE